MFEDFSEFVLDAVTVWITVVVTVLTLFGLAKVGGHLFNRAPSLSSKGIAICEDQGGTPIFEDTGKAYKACAIVGNGVKAEVK